MASKTIKAKVVIRNDVASKWASTNPVLLKGEMAVEINTGKFKFGDGVKNYNDLKYASVIPAVTDITTPSSTDDGYDVGTIWVNTDTNKAYILLDNTTSNAVWKQVVTPEDLSDLGAGDMLKSEFATNSKVSQGYVDKAILADSATKLVTGRTFELTSDATGTSAAFDGTNNVTIAVTLKDSGVAAGIYTKVTVDAKGRVTVGDNLAEADIPDLHLTKIVDAGTAAAKDVGVAEGNVPVLGADGKLDTAVLPAIAITQVFEADGEAAMLALTAQTGDVCVRSDIDKSFILKNNDPTEVANWVELKTPTDTVLSVNGKTGTVTLTTTDISEGTNLYYTEGRATANFNTNIANTEHTSLKDGVNIMMSTDEYIIDGGGAE